MPALGVTEGDGGRDDDLVGDLEECAQLVLDRGVPHGHHPAEATGPCGQQQVLTRRVDGVALIGIRWAVARQARQYHDRHLFEVLDVVLEHGSFVVHLRVERRDEHIRPHLEVVEQVDRCVEDAVEVEEVNEREDVNRNFHLGELRHECRRVKRNCDVVEHNQTVHVSKHVS